MHLDNDIKLDFKDVLIRPKRSTLTSRSQVDITREIKFRWSSEIFQNIPIIAANMDTTGTFEMARALGRHKMMTALHKHYEADQYIDFFICTCPACTNADFTADFRACWIVIV